MKSFALFGNFLRESWQEVLNNFGRYSGCYIAFVLVDFLASIPWAGMGYEENSFASIMTSILVGIINLIIVAQVLLIEKAQVKGREKEALLYAAPTYLIYTLYYSIIFLIGLACFIIPGIVLIIVLGLLPMASVLIDNDSVNYFKVSIRMARKDLFLMTALVLTSVGTEFISMAFDLIPDWQIKLGVNIAYSFLDALIIIVVTKASVRTFYHLKKLAIGESVY